MTDSWSVQGDSGLPDAQPISSMPSVGKTDLFSYLLAAIAAFGNALANVMQRKASMQKAPGTEFDRKFLLGLTRNPTWIIGFSGMVAFDT